MTSWNNLLTQKNLLKVIFNKIVLIIGKRVCTYGDTNIGKNLVNFPTNKKAVLPSK